MRLSVLSYAVVLALVWAASAQTISNCGINAPDSSMPKVTSLQVFPNPARVGQQVHIVATVFIADTTGIQTGDIKDGTLNMEVKFNQNTVFSIGMPLCNASSAIVCSSWGPGDNTLNFDYIVPQIPFGTYSIKLQLSPDPAIASKLKTGCVSFDVEIQDPAADHNKYVSYIQATLAGDAQFENPNYLLRTINDTIQIGPIGSIAPILSYTFPWGTFIDLEGSGDLIQPNFKTAGYVWGLNGQMEAMAYQGTARQHIYTGDFYVGYVSDFSKRTFDVEILSGTFVLDWSISNAGVVTSNLTGNITFNDGVVLPLGFSNPLTVGLLGTLSVTTDAQGMLLVQGRRNICLDDPDCNEHFDTTPDHSDDLEGWQIGLITGIVVGVGLIFIVIIAAWRWYRRSKRHEEEDGIFSAARKPEYGNALVVDDIIQETREHSPNMVPPLSRSRGQDFSDTESDYSRRSRSRSRTPDSYRGRSASPPRSRSRSASRSYDSESDYTDAGSSADRV